MNAVSYPVAITNAAKLVAPSRAVATIRKFEAGAYPVGKLFRSSNGIHYLVLTAQTITDEPNHRRGIVDGVLCTPHKRRESVVLQNVGSVDLYFHMDDPGSDAGDAVAAGLKLAAGATISLTRIQSAVYALTAASTTELRVAEIFE